VLVKKCGHGLKGVCRRCEATSNKRVIAWLTKHGETDYPPAEVAVALGGDAKMRLLKEFEEAGFDKLA